MKPNNRLQSWRSSSNMRHEACACGGIRHAVMQHGQLADKDKQQLNTLLTY